MEHGSEALALTLGYLQIHFVIVAAVAVTFSCVDFVIFRLANGQLSAATAVTRAVSNLSCASLGFVIAFFLAQGITDKDNTILTTVSAPLLALVTAGLAIFENRSATMDSVLRTGAAAFLVTCVLSYETLNLQLTHYFP